MPEKWLPFLRRLLAASHPTQAAPAACLLAIVYWLQGNEAATNAALDASAEADADYSLAHLVRSAVGLHLPAARFADCLPTLQACYSC